MGKKELLRKIITYSCIFAIMATSMSGYETKADDSTKSDAQSVSTESDSVIETVYLDNPIDISSSSGMVYYGLSVSEDGTYYIFTEGEYDTCGTLYDEYGNEIGYNDDGESDYNFELCAELMAGEKYIVGVRELGDGPFNATLNFCDSQTWNQRHAYISAVTQFCFIGESVVLTPSIYSLNDEQLDYNNELYSFKWYYINTSWNDFYSGNYVRTLVSTDPQFEITAVSQKDICEDNVSGSEMARMYYCELYINGKYNSGAEYKFISYEENLNGASETIIISKGDAITLEPIVYDYFGDIVDLNEADYIYQWYYGNDGKYAQEETYVGEGVNYIIESLSEKDFYEYGGYYKCKVYNKDEEYIAEYKVELKIFETREETVYADIGDSITLEAKFYDADGNQIELSEHDVSYDWYAGDNQYTINNEVCVIENLINDNDRCYCDVYFGEKLVATAYFDILPTSEEPPKMFVEGFQINTQSKGIRTVYSYDFGDEKVKESGLIYGLGGYVEPGEVVLNSDSDYVKSYVSSQDSKLQNSYISSETSCSHTMTMKFVGHNVAQEFTQEYYVRAYSIMENGKIKYSDVVMYNTYDVADTLYQYHMMSTKAAFDYLYDGILSVVNPYYVKINYVGDGLIRPNM